MMNLVSAVLALSGFCLASSRFFGEATAAVSQTSVFADAQARKYFFVFLAFLAWALGNGLVGLILVWGYFGDMSLGLRYGLNGLAGLLLLAVGWPAVKGGKRGGKGERSPLKWKEGLVLAFIVGILLLYCYRVTIPWGDQDEAAAYGHLSKLMSTGRTFSDIIREVTAFGFVRSHLVQCWDAHLYGLVNDTYLIRLNRLVNFLFCGVGLFAFLRMLRVRRFWSLVGVAAFWSTPELSYLALSLKVDSVVMMFELAAFLAVIMAFIIYDQDRKSKTVARTSFYLTAAALLFSAFAFGNRFSGINALLLCFGAAWFFLMRWSKRPFRSFFCVFALAASFMFIAAPGYWFNIAIYGNPIYPVKGFWPFQGGEYTLRSEFFSKNWNITGLPPVILQGYLIFALGMGIELLAKALPFLNALPMAVDRTSSMGWPYPLIFALFLWPFFWKTHRGLNLIFGVFLFQFILWSLEFHYSRIFIASSTLMILAAVIMADWTMRPSQVLRKRVQNVLRVWIIFSLGVSLLLQLWWFQKRYWGPFLISPEARYEAQRAFLRTREYQEENIFTFSESQLLNSFFMKTGDKPVVYVASSGAKVIQILLDARIHVKEFDADTPLGAWPGEGRYLLVNPAFVAKEGKKTKEILRRYFPVHVLTTPETHWEVYRVVERGKGDGK